MIKWIKNRIGFLTNRSKKPYLCLYRLLGFFPNDILLYEQALLHKSSSRINKEGKWENNERLEFLGDAVLDTIIADLLYHQFPFKKEGFLTNTRSKIVQRESLNHIAIQLGLDKHLVVSSTTKTNIHHSCVLGNALEALIGAIYLDQGYEMTKKFIQSKIVNPYINFNSIAKKEVNFKSVLIEWSQKYKIDITFDLIEEFTDKENQLVFQTRILVGGQPVGVGVGHSKKESQQKAAEMTMQRIRKDKELLNTIFASKNKESEKEALSDLDREICDEEIPSENA